MTQPSNFVYTDEQDEYIEIANELEQVLGDAIRDHELVLIGHPTRWANGHQYWRDGELGVDTDTAGMMWVHPIGKPIDDNETGVDAGIPFLVLNDGGIDDSQSAFGTPVKIKRQGGVKVIDGLAGDIGTEYYHNVKVRNQRSVDISQLDYALLKPTDPPSLSVFWSGAKLTLATTAYDADPRPTADLYSPAPSSGNALYVMIEYDPVANDFVYTRGSAFAFDPTSKTPQHAQAKANRPSTINAARFLCGWVRIFNGMVNVLIGDIVNAQEFLHKGSPNASIERGLIVTSEGLVLTDRGAVVRYDPLTKEWFRLTE